MSTVAGPPAKVAMNGRPAFLKAILVLGLVPQGLAFSAFIAALPQMAVALGHTGQLIAQMSVACVALGVMSGGFASGRILARMGGRDTLLLVLIIFAASGLLAMFCRNAQCILAGCFGVGFSAACIATTCMWGITTVYEGKQRVTALGLATALSNCAAIVSGILGGILARNGGWPLSFVEYPLFAAFALGLVVVGMKQHDLRSQDTDAVTHGYFKKNWPFYLLTSLLFTTLFIGPTQLVFLLADDGIEDPVARSLILSAVPVLAACSSAAYGFAQEWLRGRRTLIFALVCMAAGLALAAASYKPIAALLGAAFIGLSTGLVVPYVYQTIAERTEAQSRSNALGMINVFAYLGGFLNPLVVSTLANWMGMRNGLLAIASALLLFGTAIAMRRGPEMAPL